MSKQNVVKCDGCGKTKQTHESTGSPWLSVSTAASPLEYQSVMERLQQGAEAESLIDHGDFCSLRCLGEWALARDLLRSTDTEMTGDGTY